MSTTDAWPPAEVADLHTRFEEWDAWYSGDEDRLAKLYTNRPDGITRQRHPGIVGRMRRWFWGEPQHGGRVPQAKVHVPLAGDICQASSDLLWGEPPTVTVDDDAAQARLDLMFNTGEAHQVLASAAETAAALGGVYVRVVWDQPLVPHPFLSRVDADLAVPEFTWGRLSAVTFWRIVRENGGAVYRHLERHEVDAFGVGVIQHRLHVGTHDTLGRSVRLDLIPETAGYAEDDGQVSTLTPGLDVVYIPNQAPARAWRKHPIGSNLGRSDLESITGLLDRLDEAWSSWLRELRIGKARIVAAQSAMTSRGPGAGAEFDLDREVYEPVNTPPGAGDSGGDLPVKAIQFQLRVEEHRATCQELLEQILRSAGYSAQTFGADESGGAITATEVQARERRSFTTRKRKMRAWEGALEALAVKALAIDAAVFGGERVDLPVSVSFPPAVSDAPETVARTVQALRNATAASIETAVRMAHPDWSEPDVTAEVDRIREEQGEPAPDPEDIGGRGYGLDDLDPPEDGDPADEEDPEREE